MLAARDGQRGRAKAIADAASLNGDGRGRLVPIAVAYHLAHYVSLLLTTGQFIIPLASDPFGCGWDLFGTRCRAVDLGVVEPYVVLVRQRRADRDRPRRRGDRRPCRGAAPVRDSRRTALLSQLPMIALMVAYTSLSLWILAQPIVG